MTMNVHVPGEPPGPGDPVPGGTGAAAGGSRSGPIRIGLIDDHHLVRESLRLVLDSEADLEVVGQAASHPEAFHLMATASPDVLLLDLGLPDGDGISLLRALRDRYDDLKIIVVTMDRGTETVRQALAAGAWGYVVKGAHAHELVEAIRAVARGEQYLHSSVTSAVISDSIRWTQTGTQLSLREREIVGHLAAGLSPAAIGRLLGISVHTVNRHVANLSAKLGLRGRSALTRYAIEHDLIPDR
jgi:DNA-binding NarL/FixJ family response regulator